MSNSIQEKIFLELFDVSRETINKLNKFSRLLIDYNQKINLIGKNTISEIWTRHFADSAKIYSILWDLNNKCKKEKSVCDIGTGAGLPGVVLAIMNEKEKLELNFSLVDSNKKKIKFLEIVKKELDLNLCLINKRAENIQKKYDIIISRAVAPLDKFFNYSKELIKKDTVFILPKGKTWAKEVNELKKKWNYDVNIVTNNKLIDNSGGVSLVIKQVVIKK